jgi:hypothetical protein
VVDLAVVERTLRELFIAVEGAGLRREERKKAVEATALLGELSRLGRDRLLVDAAAGKAYVGFLAAELLGFERVAVIERDAARIRACREGAARLRARAAVELREGDVGDPTAWPKDPGAVVALHACGAASDRVIDAATGAGARWIFLVPCCYGAGVPFVAAAESQAERLGIPRQAEVRRRFVQSLIDAERALRLEAAGYETTVVPFVPPTITPHNLLFRARRAGEPGRMRAAAERLARLRSG